VKNEGKKCTGKKSCTRSLLAVLEIFEPKFSQFAFRLMPTGLNWRSRHDRRPEGAHCVWTAAVRLGDGLACDAEQSGIRKSGTFGDSGMKGNER